MSIGSVANYQQKDVVSLQNPLVDAKPASTGAGLVKENTRSVQYSKEYYIDFFSGKLGSAENLDKLAHEIVPYIEDVYYEKTASAERWKTLNGNLKAVSENVLGEFGSLKGIVGENFSSVLDAAENLATNTTDKASQEDFLVKAKEFCESIQKVSNFFTEKQIETEMDIVDQVESVNNLLQSIAYENKQIKQGAGNFSKREEFIGELAKYVDVKIVSNLGQYAVQTHSGQNLIENDEARPLEYKLARVVAKNEQGVEETSRIEFSGKPQDEVFLETLTAGTGSDVFFRLSYDGGRSWLKDADSGIKMYQANTGETGTGQIDIQLKENASFSLGEQFIISSHSGLYQKNVPFAELETASDSETAEDIANAENTANEENSSAVTSENILTPQVYFNGQENKDRVVSGSISALFQTRDTYIANYKGRLDTFSTAFIREAQSRVGEDIFTGNSSADIAVNNNIAELEAENLEKLTNLRSEKIDVSSSQDGLYFQNLPSLLAALSGKVSADTRVSKFNTDLNEVLAADALTSKVIQKDNLTEDIEEMAKIQHSYTAVMGLLGAGNKLLQSVVGMKM